MSLINDVLRDLDRRRGKAPDPGLGQAAVPVRRHRGRRLGTRLLATALGLVLVGAGGAWLLFPSEQALVDYATSVQQPAPAAESQTGEPPVESGGSAASSPPPTADTPPAYPVAALGDAMSKPETAEPPQATVAEAQESDPAPTPSAADTAAEQTPEEAEPLQDAVTSEPAVEQPQEVVATDSELRIERRASAGEREGRQLYRRALSALDDGDTPEARRALADALNGMPELHAARELLARLLMEVGDYAAAGDLLQAGLELKPDHPGLARLQARVLMHRGRADAAIRLLADTLPRHPGDGSNHALLAALYRDQSRPAEAVPVYRELVRAHPEQGVWWLGLGLSLEEAGDTARALAAYQRTLQADGLDMELVAFVRQQITALEGARDG